MTSRVVLDATQTGRWGISQDWEFLTVRSPCCDRRVIESGIDTIWDCVSCGTGMFGPRASAKMRSRYPIINSDDGDLELAQVQDWATDTRKWVESWLGTNDFEIELTFESGLRP